MSLEIGNLVRGILYEGFDIAERGGKLDIIESQGEDLDSELELLVEEGSFRFTGLQGKLWDHENEFIGRGFRLHNFLSNDGIDDIFVYYKGKLVYRDAGYWEEETTLDVYEKGDWEKELYALSVRFFGEEQLSFNLA